MMPQANNQINPELGIFSSLWAILFSKTVPLKCYWPICSNMDGPRDCHTEWSKSDREREILYDIAYMWNLKRNDTNEHIYKTEMDSET